MKLPGIHLDWTKHRGRHSSIIIGALAPIVAIPDFIPAPPTSKPGHGGTPMMAGGSDVHGDSWIVTGGSTMPYMTPPNVVKTYFPPYRYTIPSPISPLLGLGFGLNLAILAAEVLGVQTPGQKEYYPGTDLEIVY